MILLVDNYDSFVFTLARYLQQLGCETFVVRNDALTVPEVEALSLQAIVISPGPCSPNEAGISLEVIRSCSGRVPILGVCLGHQAIAAAWGGRVVASPEPMHGMTSEIHHQGGVLFDQIPSPFRATRYHSLIAETASLPSQLQVTATTAEGLIMAVQHEQHPTWGVQFHPEAVLREYGHQLLANFLRLATGATHVRLPEPDHRPTGVDLHDFYMRPLEDFPVPPW